MSCVLCLEAWYLVERRGVLRMRFGDVDEGFQWELGDTVRES